MTHWGGSEESELDRRNQQRASSLASQVSQLKSIAVDLEHETYEHNRLIDGMDSDFMSGDSLLRGSLNRVKGVLTAGQKNRKAMCYTCGAVVLFFVIAYYLVSQVGSSG